MDDTEANTMTESENSNFVQLNRGFLAHWRSLIRESPVAVEVLLHLVESMGRTTNAVVISYRTLQDRTGMSRATVARAIKLLKEQRWVDVIRVGHANCYAVNEQIVWQAARNQRQYALFTARVVASADEQTSDYPALAKQSLQYIPFVRDNELATVVGVDLPAPDQQEL